MLENELSYLVKELPDLDGAARKDIEQHYLSDGPSPLRLRRIADGFELTKKLDLDPADMSRKEEITIPLTAAEFGRFRPLAVRGLTKTRYYLPLPTGLTAEIDVFHGALEGLVMVEVEFPDEASRRSFAPPPWFGRDVSQADWSANSWLAGKSLADVREFL